MCEYTSPLGDKDGQMRVRDTGKLLHSWFGNAIGILGLSVDVVAQTEAENLPARRSRGVARINARITSSDRQMINGLREHYKGASDTDVIRHSLRLAYLLATGKTLDDSPISINAEAVGIDVETSSVEEEEHLPSLEREIKDRTYRSNPGPETFSLFPDAYHESETRSTDASPSPIPAGVI